MKPRTASDFATRRLIRSIVVYALGAIVLAFFVWLFL